MTEPTSEDQDTPVSFDELEQRLSRLEHVRQTNLMREKGLYRQPLRDTNSVRALMDFELSGWTAEQRNLVSPYLLDVPYFHVGEWDYAGLDTPPRELYLPCWTVAHFPQKERCSVVYCDHGHAGNWGALQQDGWCSMDSVWNDSIKETIWRFRMLEGFAPGAKDLDDWIGPARSLSSEEFEHLNELLGRRTDPSALAYSLRQIWADYTVRADAEEWKPALYLYKILTEALSEAPLELQKEWEERIKGQKPKLLN